MLKIKYFKISLFLTAVIILSFIINIHFAYADNSADCNLLITAIEKSEFQKAQKLITGGINVNCSDVNGVTPIMAASYAGNITLITMLVEAGADVKAVDNNRTTALMYSALNNKDDVETFKYLLNKGCSLNARDNSGITVLEIAQNRGNQKIIGEIKKNFDYLRNQIFNISLTALIFLFFIKFMVSQNESLHRFMDEKNAVNIVQYKV